MSESPRPDRKPPVFERCPVCGTEFRQISGQRWCSRECVHQARRAGRMPQRQATEKNRP
jgi:hypothetical protein